MSREDTHKNGKVEQRSNTARRSAASGETPLIGCQNYIAAFNLVVVLVAILVAYHIVAPPPNMTLYEAAFIGDLARVKELLAKGTDPNQPRGGLGKGSWFKPLGAVVGAAHPHDVEIARLLLEHGADPHARDHHLNSSIFRDLGHQVISARELREESAQGHAQYERSISMAGVLLEHMSPAKNIDDGRSFVWFVSNTDGEPFLLEALDRHISTATLRAELQTERHPNSDYAVWIKGILRARGENPDAMRND